MQASGLQRARAAMVPPRAARRSLIAQISNHRRNIEVIAEIARRHRPESAAAIGSGRSFAKKGRIVNLPFRSDLLRRFWCRHFMGSRKRTADRPAGRTPE